MERSKQYHILNGDALLEQFPESIEGEKIITRECMVDGNVQGKTLSDIFQSRAQFIGNEYTGFAEQDYFDKVVPEFKKMQDIPDEAAINLWFEDDLFCQVNCWFVLHLLRTSNKNNPIYLVRPQTHTPYGFGGLNGSELVAIFETRKVLTETNALFQLWGHYQANRTEELLRIATALKAQYPFLLPAVKAHVERIPTKDSPGRPTQSLIQIMKELNTVEFGPVFQEFNQRESIYGFGDLQVKKLFDKIVEAS